MVWDLKRTAFMAALLGGVVTACGNPAQGQDWVRFRGPNGSGVASDDATTPTRWSPEENIKWKIALPGKGVSSPIVVGDKVFVTCYSGYGMGREEGDQKDLKRHLVCINRTSGETVWEKTVDAVLPEDPWAPPGVSEHGYASNTPVSDGERVYVFFGKTGVLAFDLEGNQLWQKSVGTNSDPRRWGTSSSPILVDDVLVVPAGAESRAIVGLNKMTGEQLWVADAESMGNVWGTPAVVELADGKKELVIGAPYEIWGLNPADGQLNWYCEANESDQFNSSVVVHEDVVFALEGQDRGAIAVKAGGSEDVSKTNVVWQGRYSGRFGSPIVHNDRMYFVSAGIAHCLNATTGEQIYKARLETPPAQEPPAASAGEGAAAGEAAGGQGGRGGQRGGRRGGGFGSIDYSSPVMADGKVYFTTRGGDIHVYRAGDQFEQLAINRVTAEREDFSATPAISRGEIFIRSDKHLFCIAEQTPDAGK